MVANLNGRPEDPHTAHIVNKLTVGLKSKLAKPIGVSMVPLDARFSTIRCKESNYANFVYVRPSQPRIKLI